MKYEADRLTEIKYRLSRIPEWPWFVGYWSGQCKRDHAHAGRPGCVYEYTKKTDTEYAETQVGAAVENMSLTPGESGFSRDVAAFIANAPADIAWLLEQVDSFSKYNKGET